MTEPRHILIAEDEDKIAAVLQQYLEAAGMTVSRTADGDAVLPAVERDRPDLLLLDIMLPGTDGLAICRELRRHGTLPVIMLTARVEEIDRLLGLELGADDYICKPFSPREVVARVRAVLRRGLEPLPPSAFRVDAPAQRIHVNGRALPLTPTEFRLLQRLVEHPGRVWSRGQLLDCMQAEPDVGDRAVDSHIKHIRRKLEDAWPGAACIHAVYGIGYRFEPPDAA